MMKHDMIKFNQKIELEIVEDCPEELDYAPATCVEVFEPNQTAAGEIVSEDNGLAEIQFGDGSMAYGVPMSSFSVIQVESNRPLV
jgi:hypothetical protein